jgi:hypothetical protein
MKRWILTGIAAAVCLPVLAFGIVALRFRPRWEREDPATVAREIALLTRQRDSLRAIVFDAASLSDLLDQRPAGDVVIGLPTPFVDAMVQHVVTGWFHDVVLRLPRMRVRKQGDVTARLGLFGRRTVGAYELDVVLDSVRGRLKPDAPRLTFGGSTIRMDVPVHLASGTGVARITLDWVSKGLAGPVCGEMSMAHVVTGQVRAANYLARGRIVLSAVDGVLKADPDFPELRIRLMIDPSRASVAALDSILATRGGLCGVAIRRANVSARIQGLVARGFMVKIPQRFFRAINLPVAVQRIVPMDGSDVALDVRPSDIVVTSSAVWLAAAVTTTRKSAPAP